MRISRSGRHCLPLSTQRLVFKAQVYHTSGQMTKASFSLHAQQGGRCLDSPGDLGQGDQLPFLDGSMEAVGTKGLHGDDGHIFPAHLLQPLDDSTQQAPAANGEHNGPRLGTQRLLQFLDDGSVAFPGQEKDGRSGLGFLRHNGWLKMPDEVCICFRPRQWWPSEPVSALSPPSHSLTELLVSDIPPRERRAAGVGGLNPYFLPISGYSPWMLIPHRLSGSPGPEVQLPMADASVPTSFVPSHPQMS